MEMAYFRDLAHYIKKIQTSTREMDPVWFDHPEWWFASNGEYDQEIISRFGHLLDSDITTISPLDQILIYDQLPRHMFRNQPAAHVIAYFLQKALTVDIDVDSLDDNRFCFALLPWRHTQDHMLVCEAILKCWQRIQLVESSILRRFLRASYERCPLQGATLYICNGFDKTILHHIPEGPPKPLDLDWSLPTGRLIISLSGGVDSMLCSWVLREKITAAIHINYNNRPTSDDEMHFVAAWCKQLNIPLYVRKFTEIQRGPCMQHGLRDVYETYTRNTRYHCYKQFGTDATVLMGHNADDCLENIFTNIAHRTKYENLEGMTELSTQDGIRFWRPMLKISKSEVVRLAKEHNIPFLPNSTPSWSQRGQIRNKIVPVLDEWHSGFVDGLSQLSTVAKELYEVLEQQIETLQITNNTICFKAIPRSHIYWRKLLARLGHNVSSKSLDNLLSRIKKDTLPFKVVMNKTLVLDFTTSTSKNLIECQLKL